MLERENKEEAKQKTMRPIEKPKLLGIGPAIFDYWGNHLNGRKSRTPHEAHPTDGVGSEAVRVEHDATRRQDLNESSSCDRRRDRKKGVRGQKRSLFSSTHPPCKKKSNGETDDRQKNLRGRAYLRT